MNHIEARLEEEAPPINVPKGERIRGNQGNTPQLPD